METQKNQLAKITPGFLEDSLQTIEKSMEYANLLLKSKLVPNHFYEKGSDGKPDYNKGKPEAVLVVLQHGMELGLSISQSLQQVVPVNGLISLKGDAAKSLILSSGKCSKWEESTEGNVDDGSYSVTIYSKRSNGEESRHTFNLSMAERAGLWYREPGKISNENARRAYFYSPWLKYTERMVRYRCLGFIARDLYPDITLGIYTTEEAQDFPTDAGAVTIETKGGQKIIISEQKLAELTAQSENLSKSVNEKIKINEKVSPEAGSEPGPGSDGEAEKPKVYTEDELNEANIDLPQIAEKVMRPTAFQILKNSVYPKRKTQKYWREAILAYQAGKIDDFIKGKTQEEKDDNKAGTQGTDTPISETKKSKEEKPKEGQSDLPYDNAEIEKQHQDNKDLSVNKDFSKEGNKEKDDLEVPDVDSKTGKRDDIGVVYGIYEALTEKPPKGKGLTEDKLKEVFGDKYKNFEDFAQRAPKSEIQILLQ